MDPSEALKLAGVLRYVGSGDVRPEGIAIGAIVHDEEVFAVSKVWTPLFSFKFSFSVLIVPVVVRLPYVNAYHSVVSSSFFPISLIVVTAASSFFSTRFSVFSGGRIFIRSWLRWKVTHLSLLLLLFLFFFVGVVGLSYSWVVFFFCLVWLSGFIYSMYELYTINSPYVVAPL